jgi:hypothetical protein
MTIDPKEFKDSYDEYARKMDLFMEGPTTTYFQQLIDAGIQLPDPDSVSDTDIRTKLWEVIAGLEKLRVFLEHTNHLDDRGLYTTLWRETLRGETPAIDEIGFRSHLDLTRARFEVLVDVLNALNETAEEEIATDYVFSPNLGLPTRFVDPRRAMVGVRLNLGR